MTAPIRATQGPLAGLQALMERQRQVLLEGSPDELGSLGAQLRRQVQQVRQGLGAEGTPQGEAARAELERLNQLAATNLELLYRRMAQAQSSLDAIGSGIPLLDESRARQTYEAAGGVDALPVSGRALGLA